MKRIIAGVSGVLAGGVVAFAAMGAAAQTTAAAGPPQPQVQAAPEAPVDPARMEAARRLLRQVMDQMDLKAMIRSMDDQMVKSLQQANPKVDPAVLRAVFARSEAAMNEVMPSMMDDMATAYASALTEKEMQDTLAFYQSPSGRSIMTKMPVIMRQASATMFKYLPKIIQAAAASACDTGAACTPQDRQVLAAIAASAGPRTP